VEGPQEQAITGKENTETQSVRRVDLNSNSPSGYRKEREPKKKRIETFEFAKSLRGSEVAGPIATLATRPGVPFITGTRNEGGGR